MSDAGDFHCPNCGAPLSAQGENQTVQCPFCGTEAIVPPELRAIPDKPPVVVIQPNIGPALGEVFKQIETARVNAEAVEARQPVRTRRRSSPLGCLLILALMVGLGLFLGIPGSQGKNSLVSIFLGTPTPTVLPISRELTSNLPRTLRYGGLSFQVTQGSIDNQGQANGQVTYLPGKAFARLTVRLQNTTQENISLDPGLFNLKLADGQAYPLAQDLTFGSGFAAPPPDASNNTQLVFSVPPDAQWQGSTLVIGDGESEPEVLPLTGTVSKDPYPIQVSLPKVATTAVQGIRYEVLGSQIDLNSGSQRSKKGTRFLIIKMRMTNTGATYGANLSSDNYRLSVNGVPQAPVSAPIEVVDYQASMDREVVFQIPAGATSATLQVGDVKADSGAVGSLQLNLPGAN